jgi:fatty acid desaturase
MSEETRQVLKTVLVAGVCVAALTALAWWSVVGMVFVALAALVGLAVGWHLGVQHALAEADQARRTRRRRLEGRAPGGRGR